MRLILSLFLLLLFFNTEAQNYHAMEGSPYAGSLGVANNPASILSTPYPWDLTIFSFQLKNSSNAIVFHNLSLLKQSQTIDYNWTDGDIKRFATFNFNIHLLNARINIGRKQAIAFGANLRGYTTARTGKGNYNDTLQNMNQFFDINEGTVYNGNMVSNSWLELFGTYSRTLWDDAYGRLNGGITLKADRGLSGAFVQLNGGEVTRTVQGLQTIYYMKAGSARYGYSANYDWWKNGNSTLDNIKNFLSKTENGASMDLGMEYLVKTQAVHNVMDEDDYYDYEWKIGVSLLDVGENLFRYGSQSRAASSPRSDVSDSALNAKFDEVGSLAEFNDSLATIVNNITSLGGQFKIWTPARLVINVDRPLPNNFALNFDLSLNLTGSNNGKRLYAKEMNFLTVVPRWEKKNIGLYAPTQITNDGKFWIGGAGRLGPLLLGVHNLATIVSKNRIQNGGFYLAIVIKPGKGFLDKEDKRYGCPDPL